MSNFRAAVVDMLDDWSGDHKQAKNLINCLVEFLVEDPYWLNENISVVDRETWIKVSKLLEYHNAK